MLSPEAVQAAVSPFTGKNKDFGDIQRALEALEQSYRNRGYGVVQVLLSQLWLNRPIVEHD